MQGTCDEEGRSSAFHFLQGSKFRDEKHNEEVTKNAEKCHLEPGVESILNKIEKDPEKYFAAKHY